MIMTLEESTIITDSANVCVLFGSIMYGYLASLKYHWLLFILHPFQMKPKKANLCVRNASAGFSHCESVIDNIFFYILCLSSLMNNFENEANVCMQKC